jgi:hypothetical protein
MGFIPVPSGATSGSKTATPAKTDNAPFKPGDPIGAVLLNGDFTVAATGTVTHVDGDHVYAFGHPFLDMGEISFPMAKSEIVTVMPSLSSSFKFSNTGTVVGAFKQDRSTGIKGLMGEEARTIPVDLTVDGTGPLQTYHVNVVRNTQLSPLILAMAVDSVVANAQRAWGGDVATRLSAALGGEDEALRAAAAETVREALVAAGATHEARLERIVLAGNTVMAHLALGAFRRDMEAACDASLVARTGRDQVPAYAQTILASAARPVPRSLCALTSIDELKGRLMMLNATHGTGRKLAGLLFAGAVAAVGLAVAAPASADEPKTKEVRTVIIEHDGKGEAGAKWGGDPEHMKIDCPGKLTTVEADGAPAADKKERAKIVLCSKGGTTAEQIKGLEGALARIDSNSDMDAGVKADIKAKLQAKIDELRR